MNRRLRFLTSHARIIINLVAFMWIPLVLLPGKTPSIALQTQDARPSEVKLFAVTVTFHTKNEDKEKDTAASLYVKLNDGNVVAQIENVKDYFKDRTSKIYTLSVLKTVPKNTIEGCTATVKTKKLEGHDSWRFAYEIEFVFSDRSRTKKQCPAVTISENDSKVCPL